MQSLCNRRIPFLKFFLKQQLVWVPFLGVAWWALDFPFMRRYSSAHVARHPEDRGKDLAVTRHACEKFAQMPTSVMNFVEGTRFTPAKHAAFKSPYRHLLPPRAGGTSFVLSAMGGILHAMLDVTIVYAEASPTLWDLCCGRLSTVWKSDLGEEWCRLIVGPFASREEAVACKEKIEQTTVSRQITQGGETERYMSLSDRSAPEL